MYQEKFDIQKIKELNVVISGLIDSFSSGLLIGKIKILKKDDFRYSNNIIITPIVEFDNLEQYVLQQVINNDRKFYISIYKYKSWKHI